MSASLRRAGVALSVSTLLAVLRLARAQDSKDPAARPTPSPSPSHSPVGVRPIAASIDHVVEEMEEARRAPCRPYAAAGVPCFPASVEARAPEFSVAESVRHLGAQRGPAPRGAPTVGEMAPHLTGSTTPVATLVKMDPGCAARSLLKKLKGRNDTYYLYRVWDRQGERPDLRETPLDPAAFGAVPDFRFELLGRFDGECEAIAAYRRALSHVPSSGGSPAPAAPH